MVLIALLLIAAGVGAAAGLLLGGNTDPVTLQVFGHTLPQTNTLAVFASGAGSMLLVVVGVGILRTTARRSAERRRELAEIQEEHEESLRRLENEKAQLQQELERTNPHLRRPARDDSLVEDLRDTPRPSDPVAPSGASWPRTVHGDPPSVYPQP